MRETLPELTKASFGLPVCGVDMAGLAMPKTAALVQAKFVFDKRNERGPGAKKQALSCKDQADGASGGMLGK